MNKDELIAHALQNTLISPNEADSNWEAANIVDAIYVLSRAIRKLGNNDASTPMGGMEALGKALIDSAEMIKSGLFELADAIREQKSDE